MRNKGQTVEETDRKGQEEEGECEGNHLRVWLKGACRRDIQDYIQERSRRHRVNDVFLDSLHHHHHHPKNKE